MEFKNRSILITGASRGIGLALAKEFARHQAHIIITLRKDDAGVVKSIQEAGALSVKTILADFDSRQGVDQFCQTIESQNIQVDVVVNNAGQLTGGLLEEQKLDAIYSMMQVNLLAVIQLCHFFIPRFLRQKRGLLINNASVVGQMHFPCSNTYSASKAGVIALTESLQGELAETPVRAMVMLTPGVKTDMYDDISRQYGDHVDLSFMSAIPAEEWAKRVVQAAAQEQTHARPQGMTSLGLSFAQHFPRLFRRVARSQFRRSK